MAYSEKILPTLHKVELTVRKKGDGGVISRAEVRVADGVYYSDQNGKVVLEIPVGEGQIAVLRARYEKTFVSFEELRTVSTYDVYLFPAPPGDNEVFIRGVKRPSVSRKTISKEESVRVAPGGDPAQITRLMPGVQASAFGTDVAIRGSGPDDSAYFVDNLVVFDIFHRIGRISIIPDQLLSDVEFSSGGFGAQYGNATGGVITLVTKSEIPEKPLTEFRVNVPFYSALFHERPLSESEALAVSYRRSYLDQVLPFFLKGDNAPTVVPYFADGHVMYTKKFDDGGHFKLLGFGSGDGLHLIFDSENSSSENGRATIDLYNYNGTIGAEFLQPLGGGWSYKMSPQYLYAKNRSNFFSDHVYYDAHIYRFHSELTKKISKKESFYIGLEPVYYVFSTDLLIPAPSDDPLFDFEEAPREELTKTFYHYNVASWATIDKQFGHLIVTPGIRFSYNNPTKDVAPDPRLNARLELDEAHAVKAAVGQYSKAPEFVESDPTFGNPKLTHEKSMHYVLGFESRWSDRWETDVEVFYKRTIDVPVSDRKSRFSNAGSILSRGAEFFVRRNLTEKWFGWLSYTFSKSEERNEDNAPYRSSAFDQTHVANLTGSYRLTGTWDLGTRIGYHTGDTYTAPGDIFYNANLDKYQNRTRDSDINASRLPDYQQIDLFATKELLFDTWRLALRFGVQYLSLRKNVFGKTYSYDYSEEQDINEIPPIPFFEVRGVL